MRKFLVVGLLALPILALSGQSAQAWCKFGFSVSLQTGGCKWCLDGGQPPAQNSCCQTTPVCNGCCGPVALPAPAGFLPLPAAPKTGQAPVAAPVQPAAYWQAGYQPAGYYGYGTTGFGNYQVPSYWYGN